MTNRSDAMQSKTNRPNVLATDLDGTLIPLDGNSQNIEDLKQLQSALQVHARTLCFVTGRHFESVLDAMAEHSLPEPEWMICDVGTSIRRKHSQTKGNPSQAEYNIVDEYHSYLEEIVGEFPTSKLREELSGIGTIRLQEDEKQGDYKLSYYVDQSELHNAAQLVGAKLGELDAPYSLIDSIDPFNGDGLIDLLPVGVSKAHALQWWCEYLDQPIESIIFAGDSGNDFAALTAGFSAILVGNASDEVKNAVKKVHQNNGWTNRLHLPQRAATSGLFEGCRHFGLIDS